MKCHEFQSRLRAYLLGEVREPQFGALVEHEASCPDCRALALERSMDLEPFYELDAKEREFDRERIRARTEGRDCRWVEIRMAEALEDPLASGDAVLVREHVADCPSCQRMRDALQALPEYYASIPDLKPDRAFTQAVLARTIGPRPGILEVFRALWRRPEAVWEAAMACALVGAILFGSRVPTYDSVSDRIQEVAQVQMPVISETGVSENRFGPWRRVASRVEWMWEQVEGRAEQVSDWGGRTRTHFQDGNYPALLEDLRFVLDPIGLYPEKEASDGDTSDEG
ncbi:MAG: zf-HC2 domain-containing protein [Candidatus Eisenbacteria bacterium]